MNDFKNLNGGASPLHSELFSYQLQASVFIQVSETLRFKNKGFLIQKYAVEQLSCKQIADQTGLPVTTIKNALKKQQITLRQSHKPHLNPSQLRYGRKKSKDGITINQSEQRVVAAIMEMKREGLGLRSIARALSKLKIPTKCRGKAWHPEMVRRILLHRYINGGSDIVS